jgi:hypothetical protein
MNTETPTTLADALLEELKRCQGLLTQYAALGPIGAVGAMFIRNDIEAAQSAVMHGDVVGMARALEKLRGCE